MKATREMLLPWNNPEADIKGIFLFCIVEGRMPTKEDLEEETE